jgi:hypothetical protein
VVNHHPACYADDSVLSTGTRPHAAMAVGRLSGAVTA